MLLLDFLSIRYTYFKGSLLGIYKEPSFTLGLEYIFYYIKP